MQMITHDPNAKLDYWFDWNVASPVTGKTWLDGDTIASATVTCADATVTITSVTHTDTTVGCWVAVTTATVSPVSLRCHIVTAAGREDDRTMVITVAER